MNNDRFKFRVWDSVLKYYKNDAIQIKILNTGQHHLNVYTDCIIEQCTGLYDKNGKLIFEGDVVINDKVKSVIERRWDGKIQHAFEDGSYGSLYLKNAEIVANIHEEE